jgi:hypothetical protein
MTQPARPRGARLLALYPPGWRARYELEVAWVLEREPLTVLGALDLLRGALDARLHPDSPSPLPVVATVGAAGLLAAHAIALAVQPVPLDWPGYLDEALPLAAIGVAMLIPAVVGMWLKLGDADGILGRLAVVLALAGHVAWLAAIIAAALRIEYGALTAIAATVAMAGTAGLGVALAGAGYLVLGGLLTAAALAGVAPPVLGWPLFAVAWSTIGLRLLLDFGRVSPTRGGPARAG